MRVVGMKNSAAAHPHKAQPTISFQLSAGGMEGSGSAEGEGEQEAVDALSQHKKSLGIAGRQLRKSARGREGGRDAERER